MSGAYPPASVGMGRQGEGGGGDRGRELGANP